MAVLNSFAISLLAAALCSAQIPQPKLSCASCHTQQAQTQPETPMGQALRLPADDPLFQTHPTLALDKGGYSYTVERRGGMVMYSVSDGTQTISSPVLWDFGARTVTFVYQRSGTYYESLVTYFDRIGALDITPGDQAIHPASLAQAAGRPLSELELQRCLGCHASGAVSSHRLSLATLRPGITCLHCHSGSDAHFAAISKGKLAPLPPHLKQLSTEQVSEFCGQCHRTWSDVITDRLFGVINVRFQPYRLATSKCFDGSDPRISCIACHDPHRNLVRDDASYDKNCLACHGPGAKLSLGMRAAHPQAKAMPVCPVARSQCVSCHMPKTEIPGTHEQFADHDIRVVRPGETYPD
jgi:hypothetical protein